jgi:hypothetical protein
LRSDTLQSLHDEVLAGAALHILRGRASRHAKREQRDNENAGWM